MVINGVFHHRPKIIQTVSMALPITQYQAQDLLIISSLQPPVLPSIVDNYTAPGALYNMTFSPLDPEIDYNTNYTVRIVLRSNNTVDVVPPFQGSFIGELCTVCI